MHRRSFIGTILGTIGASKFIVEEVPSGQIPPKLLTVKRMVRLFESPIEVLKKYKLYTVIYPDETKILMPRIHEVNIDRKELKCEFKSQMINMKQNLSILAIGLLDPDSHIIKQTLLDYSMIATSGETFSAVYTITMNI